jgi:hypothetical protein
VEYTRVPANVIPGFVPPGNIAAGRIRLVGAYTNDFTATADMWRMQSLTFVARSTDTALQFDGLTPGVWLDHIQMRETGRKYYLPEEPLAPLIGEEASGEWKLEVWDSRLGADVGTRNLISWRLNLAYVRTNPPLIRLTNQVPYLGIVSANSLRYFAVDVPCDPATVANTLMSLTPPGAVDLLFNQDAFPSGTGPGDVTLLSNTTSNRSALSVGIPPLLRRGPYYLAVRNTNPAQDNAFLLRADINCNPFVPFIAPNQVVVGPGGVTLQWSGSSDAEFRVEYSDDLGLPWKAFPQTIHSGTGEFTFTDDGSVGGPSPQRFYRLVLIQ